jgi:hypothetical protein
MKENGDDFILRRYSGGISFQNASTIENYEDNLMVTWNPGLIILGVAYQKKSMRGIYGCSQIYSPHF